MNDLSDRIFWVAKDEEVKGGEVTDYYFLNTEQALKMKDMNPMVTMEVYTRHLPYDSGWGVVTGIYEVAKLLEGLPVDVDAMEEGEIFVTSKETAAYEPVLRIRGRYRYFARFETPILGFLCSSSGFSTKAARIKLLAGDRNLLSFGTRRAHPALAPLIERAAYMAGFDGVSNTIGARLLGIGASGTMPHSFVLCFDKQEDAWRAFDEALPDGVPRIALADTLFDEKTEAILAWKTLGSRLAAVRLDTPSTRRGEWRKIIEEVRWELNVRGGRKVKIFVSGGIDEKEVRELRDVVDGFGVGTSVACAPSIDFNMKLVEIQDAEGKFVPKAKRGDLAGAKDVHRDLSTMEDSLVRAGKRPAKGKVSILAPLIRDGRIVKRFCTVEELRENLARRLRSVKAHEPRVALQF
ncbi:MAG: nicotinate phosphoribosyltransferase [Conexivisphaerales archaeon]